MIKTIAIQGIEGSYHHEAVEKHFANSLCELLPCDTFSEVAQAVASEKVSLAVMAIENTIAGAILPNYSLISQYRLKVVGEIYLSIQHQLMALKGSLIQDIKEVRSHPMALLQCERFLDNHPKVKRVTDVDTALSARDIADRGLAGVAAIASVQAAKTYGLEILASAIQSNSENFTRFYIVQKDCGELIEFDKVSLKFTCSHQKGALLQVLQLLSEAEIQIEKIQSLPIVSQPWEYDFYLDIALDEVSDYQKFIQTMQHKQVIFEILGTYKNARHD